MNLLKNFSLKSKLITLCVFMSAVSISIGLIGRTGLGTVREHYDLVVDDVMPKLDLLNGMFLDYRSVRINLRTLGMEHVPKETAEESVKNFLAAIDHYEEKNKKYSSFTLPPEEKALYDEVNNSWMYFKGVGEKGLSYYKSGKPEDHEKLLTIFFDDCPKAAKSFTDAINKIKEYHEKNGQAYVSESKESASKTNQLSLLITIVGALAGLAVGYIFAHTTSKSITTVADDLARTTSHVTETSTEVAQASDKLAQSTTEQSASLAETAASLEELTAMVAKNSDNATNTSKASETSQQKASDGKKAVERMLHSMGEINQSNIMIKDQINNSNAQLNEIVQVIQEIGNKTKVINDIVFQTKLLSFNASVEAARAGEHGKGFAVVAEEVGNLAQMSGNAAKEISDMLDSSISKVENIVKDTKTQVEILISQGNEKVQDGIQVAEECSAFLTEIVTNISSVSSMSSEISNASHEQTIGISEINKAVSQLDIVTQENSTTSQMAASSAEHLSKQAQELKMAVQVLLETAYGKNANISNIKRPDTEEHEGSQNDNVVYLNHNTDLKKRTG